MHFKLALAAAILVVAACGDSSTEPEGSPREEVAGIYDIAELSFDVQGSLPEKDILARIDETQQRQLVVSRTSNEFQFTFRDPVTGLFKTPGGTYSATGEGIRLSFSKEADSDLLLLPGTLSLIYNPEQGTLSFQGQVFASFSRLAELVPEFAEEPLRDPVPGALRAVFRRQ